MTAHTNGAPHPIGVHDVGGRETPPVEKDEHPHALWEYRVDAMMMLLSARKLLTTDELRRHIEALGPGIYESMDYYERWAAALAAAMIDRGVITNQRTGPQDGRGSRRVRHERRRRARSRGLHARRSRARAEGLAAGSCPHPSLHPRSDRCDRR